MEAFHLCITLNCLLQHWVQTRVTYVTRVLWFLDDWDRLQKHFCCTEGSWEHSGVSTWKNDLTYRELAAPPNWVIEGEGPWKERWPTAWWSFWRSWRRSVWRILNKIGKKRIRNVFSPICFFFCCCYLQSFPLQASKNHAEKLKSGQGVTTSCSFIFRGRKPGIGNVTDFSQFGFWFRGQNELILSRKRQRTVVAMNKTFSRWEHISHISNETLCLLHHHICCL